MARHCSICSDPYRLAFVDEHRALGHSANHIEALSRDPAAQDRGLTPIKDETILRHWRHDPPAAPALKRGKARNVVHKAHMGVDGLGTEGVVMHQPPVSPPPIPPILPEHPPIPDKRVVLPPGDEHPRDSVAKDVATIVAAKALEGIEDGSLRVTTAHGLQAQAMMDRREERRKDRELSISVARLLSGGMRTPAHLIVVEGIAREVTEGSLDDEPMLLGEHASQG